MKTKTILKNVTAYKCALPAREALSAALESKPFSELAFSQISTAGFVPNGLSNELVTPLLESGFYAFHVRIDQKKVPPSAVRAEVDKVAARIEKAEARKVKRKERKQIEDEIMPALIQRAFTASKVIDCFYDPKHEYLLLSNASKPESDYVTGLLVAALGKLRTSTIHVDDLSNGLTTRLSAWLNGDNEAFEGFTVGGQCRLIRAIDGKEMMAFGVDDLRAEEVQIAEALEGGFACDRIQLVTKAGGLAFTLTDKLQVRSVHHEPLELEGDEDAAYQWRHEASARVITVSAIIAALCGMFGYQDNLAEEAAE